MAVCLAAPSAIARDPIGPDVTVTVVDSAAIPDDAAHGLLVPGAGATVSGEEALASLVRGRVHNTLLGMPRGPRLIDIQPPGPGINILLALPPPGERPNAKRYPIAVVAWTGVLTSESTRITGLVSIADIAPTAHRLEYLDGRAPLDARPSADARGALARLDRRLREAEHTRAPASAALVVAIIALVLLRRGRAAVLAAPLGIAAGLALSALEVSQPWLVAAVVGIAALGGLFLPLAPTVAAFLAVYLVVLGWFPETNAFAAIGPHPESGGRFYGVTNQVETLLLAPLFAAGALLGLRRLAPLAVLALVVVGASKFGADGGGILVLSAGFLVLALRLSGRRLTPRLLAAAAAGAVALGLALVGLDAALGGDSHISRSLTSGDLFDDLGRRARLSWAVATESWVAGTVTALGLAILAWFATRRERFPAGDAFLAAIAVSLVVNDAPLKVAGYGALGAGALWAWHRSRAGD